MFYSHDQLYKHIIHIIYICMQNQRHNNKDEWHSLLEKYTSHFIWKVCVWEGVGERTELQHIDPPLYWPWPRFFLILLCCSTGSIGTHSAGCWLSLPHLITKGSGLQTNWHPIFTELYNSSTSPFSCGRHNCTHSTHPRSRL